MKARHFILPVAVVALACGTAVHQHRTLAALKEETRSVEMSLAAVPITPSQAAGPPLSLEEGAALLPEAEAAFMAIVLSDQFTPEIRKRFFLATRTLDAASLVRLIEALKKRPDLPPGYRQDSDFDFDIHFASLLGLEQPAKAIALMQDMPRLASNGSLLSSAFGQWLAEDPATAARWFETELGKDNPLTADSNLRRQAIQALFRADPDRGVDLALSILPAVPDAKEINKLAAETVITLADEREHASYLAALRRAAEKSPGNPLLEQIRAAYLNELPARLKVWSFDDVTGLVDGELSAAERLETARNLSTFSDLDVPEKWADWFAKIGGSLDETHPARKYLQSWSVVDYRAVGRWLDGYPAGEVKNELVREHASRIRDAVPEEAARRALDLPASPQRDELLAKIRSTWEKRDPAASARFAKENGLLE